MQSDTQRHTEITSYRLDDLYRYCSELFAVQPGSGRGNLRAVVSELLNRLRQNLHFDYLSFTLHDSNRDLVTVVFEAGEFQLPLEVPVLDTSLGIVLHEQRAIEVNDVESEQRFPDLIPLARQGGFRSFRIVPLSTDRNELGTLGVGRRRPGIFSSEDIRHLDHAAQLVALILENALMAEALTREKARLEMLLDVNTTLISSLDMQKLFRDVSELIQRIRNLATLRPALFKMVSMLFAARKLPSYRKTS